MTTRVLLVDDHPVFLHGFSMMLGRQADIEVVDTAGSGQEGLVKAQQQQPDVVVVDIEMPVMNGVETTRRLRALCPECQVVILSQHDSIEKIWEGMCAGALSYVLKGDPPQLVFDAIRAAARGESRLSERPLRQFQRGLERTPRFSERGPQDHEAIRLTPREDEVLRLMANEGLLTNEDIAKRMGVTPGTAKWYVVEICKKLGVSSSRHDRERIAEIAHDLGLL